MTKKRSIRIIAGQWRRYCINIPADHRIRPTPDRVRETLFNWLAPNIQGTRCLDLFSGSGALGIEAASCGAAEIMLIEHDPVLAVKLVDELKKLKAENISVRCTDAFSFLQMRPQLPFNVVFIDPPFGKGLEERACAELDRRGWLAPGALIYVETENRTSLTWPTGWEVLREKRAGHVRYHLTHLRNTERSDMALGERD